MWIGWKQKGCCTDKLKSTHLEKQRDYKLARHEYVQIRREKEQTHEKDIVDMWRVTLAVLQVKKQEDEAQRKHCLARRWEWMMQRIKRNDWIATQSFQNVLAKEAILEPTQWVEKVTEMWVTEVSRDNMNAWQTEKKESSEARWSVRKHLERM